MHDQFRDILELLSRIGAADMASVALPVDRHALHSIGSQRWEEIVRSSDVARRRLQHKKHKETGKDEGIHYGLPQY